jgi:hypothetical protein
MVTNLALEQVNNRSDILDGYNLKLSVGASGVSRIMTLGFSLMTSVILLSILHLTLKLRV